MDLAIVTFFTARRSYDSAVLGVVILSVCPSVMPECRAAAGTRVINYPDNFLLLDGYPGSEYLIRRIYLVGFSESVE